jgi:hypothetical protein
VCAVAYSAIPAEVGRNDLLRKYCDSSDNKVKIIKQTTPPGYI